MANADITISEADILGKVVAPEQPGLAPDVARSILDLRFNTEAETRMRNLMDKNNKGIISDSERAEMEKYLRVGMFLDLIQSKARTSLRQSNTDL